jgi:DNA-binding NtrC family response regulator
MSVKTMKRVHILSPFHMNFYSLHARIDAMKYLLYYLDGFVKKFPLGKPSMTVGRGEANHLVVDDEFISREHLNIAVGEESISIRDKDSSNGTFVSGERVVEATLRIGDSFSIGRIEFFLKEGSLDEFATAKELHGIFNNMRSDNERKFRQTRTRTSGDVHAEILKSALKEGMASSDFGDFMIRLSQVLAGMGGTGNFAIIGDDGDEFRIHMLVQNRPDALDALKKAVAENPGIFKKGHPFQRLKSGSLFFQSACFECAGEQLALIFLADKVPLDGQKKAANFFSLLAQETKLLVSLLGEGSPAPKKERMDDLLKVNVVAGSPRMKQLIEQAKKFARSDLFILIQGESGTGKELFARIIHGHSARAKGEFVAINCAAIPENLLESELFGYEKGAFTGAYAQTKGKLEISSGGTLVLDEIGSMAANLQVKLLRALQEQEFYRLGGSTRIKVDLRIISITNRDLKALVEAGTFRKDLYYRIVHRIIEIPPLRERKEDIPLLINFFTEKFCRLAGKRINGYTVKAYEALQGYDWDGNVRELENEVNSLVNLADAGEAIGFDLLSDNIKQNLPRSRTPAETIPKKPDERTEREMLRQLLEKNGWNKSRAARELNMTYRGLHEKLKRLGIAKPKDPRG